MYVYIDFYTKETPPDFQLRTFDQSFPKEAVRKKECNEDIIKKAKANPG